MTLEKAKKCIKEAIEQRRERTGSQPKSTPIVWYEIDMTVEEARIAVSILEGLKNQCQNDMDGTNDAGKITSYIIKTVGLTAEETGKVMMKSPFTALAGIIAAEAGKSTIKVGQVLGDGIREIGTSTSESKIKQLDGYINAINKGIEEFTH